MNHPWLLMENGLLRSQKGSQETSQERLAHGEVRFSGGSDQGDGGGGAGRCASLSS